VKATTTVTELVPGTMAYFRYRTVTKDGSSDWIEPIAIRVRSP
jgi:hypothetical protein